MSKVNWRYKNGHKRRQLRERILATEDECWLCLRPVDKSLPPFLPASPEIDEDTPLGKLPDDMKVRAAISRENCHLTHRYCNQLKGDRILPKGAFALDPPPLDGTKYCPKESRSGTDSIETSVVW